MKVKDVTFVRWIAMTSAQNIDIDISASTGVHNGDDAIRYILAGADTVQVCSVFYEKGISYLSTLNQQAFRLDGRKNLSGLSTNSGAGLNLAQLRETGGFRENPVYEVFLSED